MNAIELSTDRLATDRDAPKCEPAAADLPHCPKDEGG